VAESKLLNKLPSDLRPTYEAIFRPQDGEEYLRRLVKAADKISALIKCIDEERSGNVEFKTAKESTQNIINQISYDLPEVDVFMKEFIPSYGKTLDELS
jgi:5'-deoxynucleotidase